MAVEAVIYILVVSDGGRSELIGGHALHWELRQGGPIVQCSVFVFTRLYQILNLVFFYTKCAIKLFYKQLYLKKG